MVEIRRVRDAHDIEAVSTLAREFIAFLRDRYPEMNAEIDAYLVEQDFEGQLTDFARHFNPPNGECLIARDNGAAAGIVMLKALDGPACEMNRMFVRPSARGRGIARALCERLFEEGRRLGYREIRLSALYRHEEALPLYRSLGFETCAPFAGGGEAEDDRIIFMCRPLD